ncbi:complement receptor type 2-like [Lineus longissimus]|uniref:complement receptor type 2-like n=1 Tax=Lineus longissimus TaxID=88925 RepID=UPI002B4EF089
MAVGPVVLLVLLPVLAQACVQEQITVTKNMSFIGLIGDKLCSTPDYCVDKQTQEKKGCLKLRCHYTEEKKNPDHATCKCECICIKACPKAGEVCNSRTQTCEPFCPTETIPNGGIGNKTHFSGDIANVTCHDNYTLVGEEEVQCLPNKTWSQPPLCTKICPDPPRIEHGLLITENKTEYLPNDVMKYKCDVNFTFVGGHDSITCLKDGTWGSGITCKENGSAALVAGMLAMALCFLFTMFFM